MYFEICDPVISDYVDMSEINIQNTSFTFLISVCAFTDLLRDVLVTHNEFLSQNSNRKVF